MFNRKKLLIGVLSALTTLTMAFSLGSCGDEQVSGGNSQSSSVREPITIWTMETVYAEAQYLGYTGSLEEFIALISGQDGEDGKDGKDGVGIQSVSIDKKGNLFIILTNGELVDLGKIIGENGEDGQDGKDGEDGQDGKDGLDGVSVIGAAINELGNLDVVLSNGETIDCGPVKGATGEAGQNGVGIEKITINEKGELIVELTDGKENNLGKVVGENGKDGTNGTDGKDGVGIETIVINNAGEMVITLSNGVELNLGNVVGKDGANGTNGEDGKDGVDGKDGDSVSNATINEKGELVLTFVSGKTITVGNVVGAAGKDGADGIDGKDGVDGTNGQDGKDGVGVQTVVINKDGELVITLTSGAELNLGNVVGKDGANGTNGEDGKDGVDGKDGEDGVSVVDAEINANNELMIMLSNGETINAGKLVGSNCSCDLSAIGAGVKSIAFNSNNELVFTLTDGTTINVGKIPTCKHTYGAWVTATAANCTSMGVKTQTCTLCEKVNYQFISALGHTYTNTVVKATCMEQGYTMHECNKCDYEYRDTYTAKVAHTYGGWATMLSTCTMKISSRACTVCGVSELKSESGSWHNYTTSVVAPTCSEQGYTLYSCTECGKSYKDSFVGATGEHAWEELCVVVSTCTEKKVLKTCTECGKTQMFEEKVNEHDYVHGVCSKCGEMKTSEGLKYTLNSDNVSYSVSGIGTCTDTDIVIPTTHEGLPVTMIGEKAFYQCYGLTSVKIPESITLIGKSAFSNCKSLTSVEIPDGVVSVGNQAFISCKNLMSVTIGKGIEVIGLQMFAYCSGLTSVVIGDSVTTIGNSAFQGCSSLISLPMGKSVTAIDELAFKDCDGLTSVSIPNHVALIGKRAFSGCSNLVEITLPFVGERAGVTASDVYQYPFGYIFGTISYTGAMAAYQYYYEDSTSKTTNTTYYIPTSLKKVTITGGEILHGAFSSCRNLTSVVLPDNVTSIEAMAFWDCKNLMSVKIPDSVTSIGKQAYYGCVNMAKLEIPEGVTSIGGYAFSDCYNLTEIIFNARNCVDFNRDSGVFDYAGRDGEGIRLIFGRNVTHIPAYLGYAHHTDADLNLKQVIFDEGSICESVGMDAFVSCKSVTGVYITDIVVWCNISFANSSANPLRYAKNLYINNQLATEIVIPNTVTEIKSYVFSNCHSLTNVVIGAGVTSIGVSAFSNCVNMTNVKILEGVISIGEGAFYNCRGLSSVEISDNVTTIGDSAFEGCSGLASVVIGESVTMIGHSAFQGCSSLTSVTIPESVTSIEAFAFYECSSLTSVTFEDQEGWSHDVTSSAWNAERLKYGDSREKCESI